MKLIGKYENTLSIEHYRELLDLLEQAIAQGEVGAGTLFDVKAAQELRDQAQTFDDLPKAGAGHLATAKSLNQPLNLLVTRYLALENEIGAIKTKASQLLDILRKDTRLIDQLLAAADIESWSSDIPQLPAATVYAWNYASGYGATADPDVVAYENPDTGIVYEEDIPIATFVDSGVLWSGLVPPSEKRDFKIKSIKWDVDVPTSSGGQVEDLYGNDWTKLTVLKDNPIINFPKVPSKEVILGPGLLNNYLITGTLPPGDPPVFVRLSFLPRRTSVEVPSITGTIYLSEYRVKIDETTVVSQDSYFTENIDYVLSENTLTVIPSSSLELQDVTITFTEFFPSYECSINEINWSRTVMFDPARPYPTGTVNFFPIDIKNGKFPITDESGNHLGLYIELTGTPVLDTVVRIYNDANLTHIGASATLELIVEKPFYMTGLYLEPFTNFPTTLTDLVVYGFTDDNPLQAFPASGSDVLEILIDRPMTVNFGTRLLAKKIRATFVQQSYTIKEHAVDPPDKMRRETVINVQSALPFSVRRSIPVRKRIYNGYQYEFGFENIRGEDWQFFKEGAAGVFISGPHRFEGDPGFIRLDAQYRGPIDYYLVYDLYDAGGSVIYSNEEAITPGTTYIYDRPNAATTANFYIKCVFNKPITEDLPLLERHYLQVVPR